MRELIGQGARYGAVGLLNTLLGFACIAALQAAGVPSHLANAAGFALGLGLSYALNSVFTFGFHGPHGSAIVRFACAFLVAFALNQAVLAVALKVLAGREYLAQALAVASYAVTMFLALRLLVFRPA